MSRGGVAVGAQLVIATHNRKKLTELHTILAESGISLPDGGLVTAGDVGAPEPVEDGVTFAENALIKAQVVSQSTGLPAVADDSGLSVDVLGGAPGIFSARWSTQRDKRGVDQANNELLLGQLADVKPEHRGAAFVCAAALVVPSQGGDSAAYEEVRTGEMRGSLTYEPRGVNGFGYDPIFIPDEQEPVPEAESGSPAALGLRTSAELSSEEKNAISHRGKAFRALAQLIVQALQR